jgi:catechol 2,3-dioxygenase-like lactoylglutathione lyase family enzyme|tara:strand:+ start:1521 stop:1925 length:405 start_codon:yes stop_codon:yes gene_type:complete
MALQITKDSIDLGIITKDVAAMLVFYQDTLGLEPDGEWQMPGGGHMTRLKCGTTVVKLVVNAQQPPAESPPGGIGGATGYRYFTISVSNIAEATSACEDAGYNIAVPVTEVRPGVNISIIADPDGNWVELLQMA